MESEIHETSGLSVSPRLKDDLRAAANWGRWIAIISISTSVISLLVSLKKGSFFGALIAASLTVFIYLYLFRFGNLVKQGIETNDQDALNTGLYNLQTYFKILVFFLIIIFIIAVLAIVFLALGASLGRR
ncbi:MAG: DUF5362 family protein [Bacteroidota bacterium]